MKFSRLHIITLALAAMVAMTSCRDKLCYDHFASATVALTWEQEWERDYGLHHAANWDAALHGCDYDDLRPGLPEWVNVIRFSTDGTRHEHIIYNNKGENIRMDEGDSQSLLLYNGDTQYIILSDITAPLEARASSTGRSRSSLTSFTEIYPSARTTNPPDVLYSSYVQDVSDIKKHENRPLPVTMQPLVFTYLIRYEFDYGQEHIALARGALGGMAESVYLVDGRTSEQTAIILFDGNVTDYGCEALVSSFGVPSTRDNFFGRSDSDDEQPVNAPYTLNLEVRLNNGKFFEFNRDITDQILRQPRGGVITVSGFRIEAGDSFSDAGFDVAVDGWGDRVDIDLPVGPSK